MSRRTRSFSSWVRVVHRWISLLFTAAAAVALLRLIPAGPASDAEGIAAIALLLLLVLTGLWTAGHHYLARLRASRGPRRRSRALPDQIPG